MIPLKQIRLAIGLIFVSIFTVAFSAESTPPAPVLEFDTTLGTYSLRFAKPPPIVPTYMAYFSVSWRFAEPNEPNAADLLETSTGRSFSDRQRDLLETEKAFWLDGTGSGRGVSGSEFGQYRWGGKTYRVYAVSEADIKKMVHAVVEFVTGKGTENARRRVENLRAMQPGLGKRIQTAKEQIKAKNSELPSIQQKYMDAIRNSPYSKHPSSQVPDEVRKTIFEMDKMLDVLNIEIVGIQSKLSAIKNYSSQSDVRNSETLSTTLKEMAIRQEIDLVGAESRRQAIMSVKRREEALYNQYEAYRDLKYEIVNLENSVTQDEELLDRIERELARLAPGELTFTIVQNKATVRPLKAS